MTVHTGRDGPAGDLGFDLARIGARADELALDPDTFARRTGLQPAELERLGPSRISVTQLVRLAAVLDLPVNQLLTTTPAPDADPDPARPREGDPRDDQLVEALLLSYGRL